jgi:glycerol-3-phosphate dehydrogenase (NAD(P)+)
VAVDRVSGPTRAVVGAGAWGTTLAIMLAGDGPVTLLVRDPSRARAMARARENRHHLPGVPLPESIAVTSEASALVSATELVIMAVPAAAMRATAARIAAHVHRRAAVVSVTKGLEQDTLLRMTQALAEALPGDPARLAALSGPTLAPEIARGSPAAAVVSAEDDAVAARVVELVGRRTFRLYRNRDLVGVELCGALKNVVAIAAGASDGLGFGDNAKAAIVTRGLAEMTRLGVAMGADPMTFAGLAGIGDILATCASPLSRNHRLGIELGSGRSWPGIESTLPGVAEGAYTVRAAIALAERHGVEMPIAREVQAVLYEGKPVRRSLDDLLARPSREEAGGLPRVR